MPQGFYLLSHAIHPPAEIVGDIIFIVGSLITIKASYEVNGDKSYYILKDENDNIITQNAYYGASYTHRALDIGSSNGRNEKIYPVLNGKITNVELGAVMANVKIEISEPNVITAVITKESAEKLGLSEGDDVTAIIKSTEVILGK